MSQTNYLMGTSLIGFLCLGRVAIEPMDGFPLLMVHFAVSQGETGNKSDDCWRAPLWDATCPYFARMSH